MGISLVLRRRRRRLPVSGTSILVLWTTQAVPWVRSVLTLAAVPARDRQAQVRIAKSLSTPVAERRQMLLQMVVVSTYPTTAS